MFNGKKPEGGYSANPVTELDTTSGKNFTTYASAAEANYSIINERLTMRGDLESEADILVKGKVHGNIKCKMLIIDTDAYVEGGIVAEEVVIRGRTKGVIKAKRVRFEKTANVDSEIYQDSFSAEEGARIKGALRFTEDLASANLVAEQESAQTADKANATHLFQRLDAARNSASAAAHT